MRNFVTELSENGQKVISSQEKEGFHRELLFLLKEKKFVVKIYEMEPRTIKKGVPKGTGMGNFNFPNGKSDYTYHEVGRKRARFLRETTSFTEEEENEIKKFREWYPELL